MVAQNDLLVATNDHMVESDFDADFDEQARRLCIKLWTKKLAAAQLSIHGDVTVRQAQRIIGRRQGFSLKVYRRLVASLYGDDFLALFVAGSPIAESIEHDRRIRQARQRRREIDDELKALEAER
jgi:hypothetical protein